MAPGRTRDAEGPRGPRRGVAVLAGAGLVALVGFLLFLNYRSAATLRENLLAQHAHRVQMHASAVGHLVDTARADLDNLAEAREVAAFFENRDLGMSVEYGLALSLVPIEQRLVALTTTLRRGHPPVLARAALVDEHGKTLADSADAAPPWRGPLLPGDAGSVVLSADGRELVVTRAHHFKGRYTGHLVGWLRAEAVTDLLADAGADGATPVLLDAAGRPWRPAAAPSPAAALVDVPPDGRLLERYLPGKRGARTLHLVARVPVPGQPLSLVDAGPASRLVGDLSPPALAVNLAFAAVAVLAMVVLAVSLHTKSAVLEARLDESLRREREVAEKHAALEREGAERQRLEAEEKKLREELRQSQKLEAIGALAGGVAHDFNNLLTAINGYAGLAIEALPEGDPVRQDVEEIRKAGARAAELTRQLLAFGRRQVLKPQVLDLAAAIAGVERMLRRLIGEDVQLVTERPGFEVRVRVDPGQLEQVLVNLAVNARDAMPGGGTLRLRTSAVTLSEEEARRHPEGSAGEWACVEVSDSGVGMDPGTLARVFEPFFTTKERGKGTGLGLSTVYGIVRQSRGFVSVESRPARGTTFRIFLPRERAESCVAAPPPAPARAPVRSARPGETVLVVEDERQVRALLEAQLAAEGYAVLSAGDGASALSLAERHAGRIDLVLSDVVMPHMSGPQLAERVKELHPESRIVFISGYAEEAVAQHGRLGLADAFVGKPYALPELASTIRGVLDRARAAA
ncbi:MAG TPA: ATP-binding protein [Anaeromyxobacteraceae bacterium]|nr:ATP-binding protein [Anaeromyxobacteraceae bacterium]